uniref:Uncharacterized protein n=1 Tax=Pristionchus pacificus TaxID=54126 RepID=A0A2A6BU49_PRIPA|eukprot:PDM69434.1 hypothetical protein PRIPAC_44530 [Pristionchus pacificus]
MRSKRFDSKILGRDVRVKNSSLRSSYSLDSLIAERGRDHKKIWRRLETARERGNWREFDEKTGRIVEFGMNARSCDFLSSPLRCIAEWQMTIGKKRRKIWKREDEDLE